MKIIEGFTLRTLVGEHIVTGEGLKQVNFNKMISLNDSAAYLWQAVEGKEFTVQTLTDLLLEKYDIDAQTASKDAEKLAKAWIEAGIVEE